MSDDERYRLHIQVEDAHGRTRDLAVVARPHRVVLIPPPGEGCSVPPDRIELLRSALKDARTAAMGGEVW